MRPVPHALKSTAGGTTETAGFCRTHLLSAALTDRCVKFGDLTDVTLPVPRKLLPPARNIGVVLLDEVVTGTAGGTMFEANDTGGGGVASRNFFFEVVRPSMLLLLSLIHI